MFSSRSKAQVLDPAPIPRLPTEPTPQYGLDSSQACRRGLGNSYLQAMANCSSFETRTDDFSSVRVDGDAVAGRMLGSRAFTAGKGAFVLQREDDPDSRSSRESQEYGLVDLLHQARGVQRKPTVDELDNRRTLENEEGSERETGIQSRRTDFAIEPPNVSAEAAALTDAQVQEAIRYNVVKLRGADAGLIGTLRDVLGIDRAPAVIDEDFVNAIARWQAANNLNLDGKLGPDTAAPLFRELRAEGLSAESRTLASLVRRGRVRSGPTYTPNGVLAPIVAGGRKHVPFTLTAEFEHDPANGIWASCCEVRQQIQWNATMVASFVATGNPVPHAGFPATHPANTWIEDRNDTDTVRYGHRRAFGGGVAGNRYVNAAGNLAQANGVRFEGRDDPQMLIADTGQMRFRLSVVDVCNEDKQIGSTDNITINW